VRQLDFTPFIGESPESDEYRQNGFFHRQMTPDGQPEAGVTVILSHGRTTFRTSSSR
jgi:hypothetical protein